MSENGGSHNGDSDNSQNGDTKVCRDFVRNVCNRGKNCKFIHPENVKIRTEPIFCHDYQQSKCFRNTCKFIHCTREDEDHYKQTGELPEGASGVEYYEPKPVRGGGSKGRGGSNVASGGRKPSRGGPSGSRGGGPVGRNGFGNGRGGNMNGNHGGGHGSNHGDSDIPVCKDNLKGLCDRPPGGCKFRHANPVESYGGGMQNRRRGGNQNYYDAGPEAKRNHYSTDYDDFGSPNDYTPPPPPPPPQSNYSSNYSMYDTGSSHPHGGLTHHGNPQANASYGGIPNRNGYAAQHQHQNQHQHQQNVHGSQINDISSAITSFATPVTSNANTAAAMKALEDENFMLKRRIEELKKQVSDLVATNEYLLSQNAHLRINNMNIKNEVQVQGVSATGPAGSVVQTLVSMAQPIVINPSLSVAATQPLSTITSLPTVSMTPVSISQSLPVVSMAQHPSQPQSVYPLVTTQLPPPN